MKKYLLIPSVLFVIGCNSNDDKTTDQKKEISTEEQAIVDYPAPADKTGKIYIGSWKNGDRNLIISKTDTSFLITGCTTCPYSGQLKDGILYIGDSKCDYDEKTDQIVLSTMKFKRVKN